MYTTTIHLQDKNNSRLTLYLCDAPLAYNPNFVTPAIIICPGGGFGLLSPREMEPVALRFVSDGISAFVLEYPVGDENVEMPTTLLAAAAAVAHVRSNAKTYHVIPNQIVLCGFSAGGYVAASLAASWHKADIAKQLRIDSAQIRPNAAILCYPVIDLERQKDYRPNQYNGEIVNLTDAMHYRLLGKKGNYSQEEQRAIALQGWVTTHTCPCFLWHTADDVSVHVDNSLQFAGALARHSVPFELHVFQTGLHGLALANHVTQGKEGDINPSCAQWYNLSLKWLQLVLKNNNLL